MLMSILQQFVMLPLVLCFASAAASRLLAITSAPQPSAAAAADVVLPAILSMVSAAAVHHAPALSRLNAAEGGGSAAAACTGVAAAVVISCAMQGVRKSCMLDAGAASWGRSAVWGTAALAAGCYVLTALLRADSSGGGGGAASELSLQPARVLLLQFLLALLMSALRPSLDSFCVALSCALYLAGIVSGCVLSYAAVAVMMAATCKLHVMCTSSSGAGTCSKASIFGCGCHVWTLAVISWYGTSHAPQFSSLKVSSGFAFVSSFNWHICGASLFFETFAPVLVWAM